MAKKETAKRKFIQLSEGELNYAMSRAVSKSSQKAPRSRR